MPNSDARADDDQVSAELGKATLSLADYHPAHEEVAAVAAYLAEIDESIRHLPRLDPNQPLMHGFDPSWPERER